ncbi:3-phosphoserine/phosphohydroxythreonine transaminase [Endozoicomonas sp. SM1973]|uniref:Phosphoserine aminotransferase n=1 Tax=Spartinivicinus marinus TaxID=2994442 RepID=A0A853IAC2_9GAMM|nr:3-phosphoserine/phosphohydroxythreonine transaminase [Spartinivicinus marinus]MCX4028785.1 3-phosphoserine/phosphohydroxythreonine transaminase [Spartinivicinus marinus]NYZ67598.1 3-phosphoserine/phosphohydroxythreonine transaminase [Spartinivicinus marinus]
MSRAFNFCSGPASMPEAVLAQAQQELLDWQGRGVSVMEVSHRSPEFVTVVEEAEQDLRDLMAIPDEYAVLFMQGGATAQFATIPMNLLGSKQQMDYVDTGVWSQKASKEAARYGEVNIVASAKENNYSKIPEMAEWRLNPQAAYLHYTPNETINGVEFAWVPETGEVPLVADMSSSILSRPIDVSQFGLIYAGAQKNIGPAGLVVIIVKKSLFGNALPITPSIMNYEQVAKQQSMLNTPPSFAIYLAGLVFKWLKQQGGVAAMEALNQRKAEKLYQFIDQSSFYQNPVDVSCRSWMNIPFTLADDKLDKQFLVEAEANQLLNLKGHRLVGGMRASLYNAIPEQAVDALIEYMKDFEQRCG